MIFGDKMCNNAIQLQQQAKMMANENSHIPGNLVDPFSFSALHFLRAYNKLLTPADLSQCYNFTPTSTSSSTFVGFQNIPPLPPLDTILPNKILQLPSSTSSNDSNASSSLIVDVEKPKPDSVNFISTSSNQGNHGQHDSQGQSPIYINKPFLFSRRQRGEKRPIPEEQKDGKYFERRKRNNEAAKKSRDARKMREDRIALRAALLEQENSILRAQTIALKEELFTLRQILCNRSTNPQMSNI